MKPDFNNIFYISTDKSKLDLAMIHDFLKTSYWAENIPISMVAKSIEHSLCFGVYEGPKQVGFARVISDYTTFAYLTDVFILAPYRGQGLGKWFIEFILASPELQGLRSWLLVTTSAQSFYHQLGFKSLKNPERWMLFSDFQGYPPDLDVD